MEDCVNVIENIFRAECSFQVPFAVRNKCKRNSLFEVRDKFGVEVRPSPIFASGPVRYLYRKVVLSKGLLVGDG